jgi:hypothetical protein
MWRGWWTKTVAKFPEPYRKTENHDSLSTEHVS